MYEIIVLTNSVLAENCDCPVVGILSSDIGDTVW